VQSFLEVIGFAERHQRVMQAVANQMVKSKDFKEWAKKELS